MQTISQNCKRLFNQCKAGGESDDSKIFFEQTVCRAIQNHLLLMNGNEENFCFRPLVPKNCSRSKWIKERQKTDQKWNLQKSDCGPISWLFLFGEFHLWDMHSYLGKIVLSEVHNLSVQEKMRQNYESVKGKQSEITDTRIKYWEDVVSSAPSASEDDILGFLQIPLLRCVLLFWQSNIFGGSWSAEFVCPTFEKMS